ncbi:unnamed protein product [Gongylonema pulchrum]|uniref:SAM domain-containing protein n=1 Tax=Gongylonema pulchrum TaxID=637853 RepID=A0A183DIH8_9BILA|nr:unnamed protein product [Gongylonema pulchrum]
MSSSSSTEGCSVLKWQRFFCSAGIPAAIAAKYSRSFAEQRVQFTMLEDLDKATLIDLGVNTIGDQVRTFGIKTVDALASSKILVACFLRKVCFTKLKFLIHVILLFV